MTAADLAPLGNSIGSDDSVAHQREPRGPAANVHAMASETTAAERHPDVADVLKSGAKPRRRTLIEISLLAEHRQPLVRHQGHGQSYGSRCQLGGGLAPPTVKLVVDFQRVALALDEQANGRWVGAGVVGIERVLKKWRAGCLNPKCHSQHSGGDRCVHWCGDMVDVAARSIFIAVHRQLVVDWEIE